MALPLLNDGTTRPKHPLQKQTGVINRHETGLLEKQVTVME